MTSLKKKGGFSLTQMACHYNGLSDFCDLGKKTTHLHERRLRKTEIFNPNMQDWREVWCLLTNLKKWYEGWIDAEIENINSSRKWKKALKQRHSSECKRPGCTHQLSITGVWGRGWEGRLSFSDWFWKKGEKEEGGRVSLQCTARLLHISRAQSHKEAGAPVNKPPTFQWSWRGGAGMVFKLSSLLQIGSLEGNVGGRREGCWGSK